MKLSEIKDDNGTSLQAYAETIMAKAKSAGLVTVLVFLKAASEGGTDYDIHALSSADGSPGSLLVRVGKAMLAVPSSQHTILVSPEQEQVIENQQHRRCRAGDYH